jgi:S-adenosylmethionine decarboxylase
MLRESQFRRAKEFSEVGKSLMIVGTEWLIDASGCRPETLRDTTALRRMFDCIISDLKLQVVGEQMWHCFPTPGGITGLALLTESHLACHTYPEFRTATINLYCCRERAEWPWAERLAEILGAQSVTVRVSHRVVPDEQTIHTNTSSTAEPVSPSIIGGGW